MRFLSLFCVLFWMTSCHYKPESEASSPQQEDHAKNCERLHELIKTLDYGSASELIKNSQVDVNCKNEWGSLPILEIRSVDKKALELFNVIVNNKNFNANATNIKGENSLFAYMLKLEQIKALVQKGADINKVDLYGDTPLNTHSDFLGAIKFIIEHKKYIKNQSSLDRMLHDGIPTEALTYLISKGALVSFNRDNRSPLHSVLGGEEPISKAKLILEQAQKQGFDLRKFINHPTKISSGLNQIHEGETALHEAVRLFANLDKKWFSKKAEDLQSVVERLIVWGADPDLKNKAGESAREIAARSGYIIPAIIYKGFPN